MDRAEAMQSPAYPAMTPSGKACLHLIEGDHRAAWRLPGRDQPCCASSEPACRSASGEFWR